MWTTNIKEISLYLQDAQCQIIKDHPELNKKFDDIFKYIYKGRVAILDDTGKVTENFSVSDTSIVKHVIPASNKKFSLPKNDAQNIDEYIEKFRERYSQYWYIDGLSKRDYDVLGNIVANYGFKEYEIEFKVRSTLFFANSDKMGSDYWVRPFELFARAFETYIYDKLEKAGRENNYLVSGDYFDRPEGVYPHGKEREVLYVLYDRLFTQIKKDIQIPDFKTWTSERVDEYIALEEEPTKKKPDSGIVVSQKTGKIVEKIGNPTPLQEKLKKFHDLINNKLQQGGTIKNNQNYSDKLIQQFH